MNKRLNEFLDQYTEDIKNQFYKQDEEAEVNVPTSQSSILDSTIYICFLEPYVSLC